MAQYEKKSGGRGRKPQPTQNPQPAEKKNKDSCPLYKKCGGCQMQNLTYPEQLAHKQRQVERLLREFCPVRPIVGMETPYHYRNKVQAAFAPGRGGQIISGVYQSTTRRIVPMDHCMTEDEMADRIIVTIRKLMPSFKMTAYDPRTGYGFLRHVLVRRGFKTGEVMVVLVSGSPVFPSKRNFVRALVQKHPEITTVVHSVNRSNVNLLLGNTTQTLHGKGYIEDELCGSMFRISPRSFYQINPVQTEVLYNAAVELAALTGRETVIDAYCGIGTIGITAARAGAGQVIGVELNGDAVRDARDNARRNGIENIRFYEGDAGAFMTQMAEAGETADVVFMDPPRAGSDEKFLAAVLRLAPKKVVYVSCNPETMARDIKILTAGGYRCVSAQPVDMFPHTHHVETVALLVR